MLTLNDLFALAQSHAIPQEKRRGIVREYIQTLILSYIQQSELGARFIFIGGTALRFFYNLARFSEDLDFNFKGRLQKTDIHELLHYIQKEFSKENIEMSFAIRKSSESYFHWKVYLQFHNVLRYYKCAGRLRNSLHPLEKLTIQMDIQNLGTKEYPTEKKIISHFGKRFIFTTTSLEMFLAEKSNAMLYRKIPRGRDFFDFMSLIFLRARFNNSYLKFRDVFVGNKNEYDELIKKRVQTLNFGALTAQLSPFLFRKEDIEIMNHFTDHITDLLSKIDVD